MALVKITDHTRRAILHLPPPLWGKPRIASCLRAITDEIQELEDAIWNVMLLRLVDQATGAQLLVLGRIVGEPDLGYSQAIYRIQIKARIRINRGKGTVDDILAILGYAYNRVEWFSDVRLPAHLDLTLDDPGVPHIGIVLTRRMVAASHAAGVSVTFYTNVYAATPVNGLRFADAAGLVTVPFQGVYADASSVVSIDAAPLFTIDTTGTPINTGTSYSPAFTWGGEDGTGWGEAPWITL